MIMIIMIIMIIVAKRLLHCVGVYIASKHTARAYDDDGRVNRAVACMCLYYIGIYLFCLRLHVNRLYGYYYNNNIVYVARQSPHTQNRSLNGNAKEKSLSSSRLCGQSSVPLVPYYI